jgi:hypothetical protein
MSLLLQLFKQQVAFLSFHDIGHCYYLLNQSRRFARSFKKKVRNHNKLGFKGTGSVQRDGLG